MSNLNPSQFLYHGTPQDIKGSRILPAKVHGGKTYWGNTGSTRGEPSEEHAWAHPDEQVAWSASMDRVNAHYLTGEPGAAPRGTVQAVHPHPLQSPGGDPSMEGEIKAPHFDISHQIDIMPGHQGTFPGINWTEHVAPGRFLPGDEDANHPSHMSVQFGHSAGVHARGYNFDTNEAIDTPEKVHAHLQNAAREVSDDHVVDRMASRNVNYRAKDKYDKRDQHLPLPAKGTR